MRAARSSYRTASYMLSTCPNESNDLLGTVAKEFKLTDRLLNYLDLFSLAVSFGTYWKKKKLFSMERTSNSCVNIQIMVKDRQLTVSQTFTPVYTDGSKDPRTGKTVFCNQAQNRSHSTQ